MASPITVGVTTVVVAPVNKKRVSIRFQNAGATIIYIKKVPVTGVYWAVSATDYEVMLAVPAAGTVEFFETNSIASFIAISSAAAGVLAIYETSKV